MGTSAAKNLIGKRPIRSKRFVRPFPEKLNFKLTLLDVFLLLFSLGLVGVLFYFVYSQTGYSSIVHIRTSKAEWYYPLEIDRIIEVTGPIGKTVVVIKDGTVFVQESACPEKLCLKSGAISEIGGWLACLPNQVFINIEGSKDLPYDAESY